MKTLKGNFKPNAAAEREFLRSLKKVARVSGHIVESHVEGATLRNSPQMQKALNDYAKLITPWARRQSAKLLDQVQKSNKRAYQKKSKAIGVDLRRSLEAERNVERAALVLLNEQVGLITSIPIEAGFRAQKIAYEAALYGRRAIPDQDTIEELQKQLGLSTEVAVSRATLIARTETARANAAINQSRAMAVGSGFYRWHNSSDAAVRESHKRYKGEKLQGKIFSWAKPPTLDDGMTGHPGSFPNCRCFAEPIFDQE